MQDTAHAFSAETERPQGGWIMEDANEGVRDAQRPERIRGLDYRGGRAKPQAEKRV